MFFKRISNIFEALNHLNMSLQEKIVQPMIVDFVSELKAFVRKLILWQKNVQNKRYGMFKFMSALELSISDDFSQQEIIHNISLFDG